MILYTARLDDFITPDELIKKIGTVVGGDVQKAVDTAVIRECEPYVPYRTGRLSNSVHIATAIGSGEVVYSTPYARSMYYGVLYGSNAKIMHYNQAMHKFAGSYWFDRAMAENKKKILKEAQNAAKRKCGA